VSPELAGDPLDLGQTAEAVVIYEDMPVPLSASMRRSLVLTVCTDGICVLAAGWFRRRFHSLAGAGIGEFIPGMYPAAGAVLAAVHAGAPMLTLLPAASLVCCAFVLLRSRGCSRPVSLHTHRLALAAAVPPVLTVFVSTAALLCLAGCLAVSLLLWVLVAVLRLLLPALLVYCLAVAIRAGLVAGRR